MVKKDANCKIKLEKCKNNQKNVKLCLNILIKCVKLILHENAGVSFLSMIQVTFSFIPERDMFGGYTEKAGLTSNVTAGTYTKRT